MVDANPTQRHYFFNEDNKPMKSKKDLEVEERLRLMKLKMNAAEEAEVTADPNIPEVGNPYRQEVLDEQANKHNDEERTHE